MRIREIANTDLVMVQLTPPMSTLFKLLSSEGFTSMTLQPNSQVFTIGFLGFNKHYNQPFRFISNLKTKYSILFKEWRFKILNLTQLMSKYKES